MPTEQEDEALLLLFLIAQGTVLAELGGPRRLSLFARSVLLAGAVLCFVSTLLTIVTWKVFQEPLGFDVVQNASVAFRSQKRAYISIPLHPDPNISIDNGTFDVLRIGPNSEEANALL